ncbi:unnamed protein product [Rotaria magnacalcarata]|uniref:Uncharacterized protein n=1 Tax=Rotaria magnacalcarata TaxID=392030 RepID=A0A816TY64_9BILA|nr:unnamed protein product [Rotaria magnacalcarata]
MFLESNHINILLSFVRSIARSNDPYQLLLHNKRSSLLLDSLLKQIVDRTNSNHALIIDQRLENIVIALAYLAVELQDKCQIRQDILKVLLEIYPRIPTAKYYEVASCNYKHGLPPAEVFSFCLHTALTEIASTSHDAKTRDNIMSNMADSIRKIIERLRKDAHSHATERYQVIYRFEVPYLFGALRSIGRISGSHQSLMTQLFPISFNSITQSIHIEKQELTNNNLANIKNSPIAFRPIISKVLSRNVLSATNDSISQLLHSSPLLLNDDQRDYSATYQSLSLAENSELYIWKDDLPVDTLFFSVSGSTYLHRQIALSNVTSTRFRVCLTVPVLEHIHETLQLIDSRVVKFLDKAAITEYDSIHRSQVFNANSKHHFPYTYFGDILILCIIKFFRDNLDLINKSTERYISMTKATYLFVQQLITIKLLDLDNDNYRNDIHRYRTRVDANAAALELLCLSCDDEIGTLL